MMALSLKVQGSPSAPLATTKWFPLRHRLRRGRFAHGLPLPTGREPTAARPLEARQDDLLDGPAGSQCRARRYPWPPPPSRYWVTSVTGGSHSNTGTCMSRLSAASGLKSPAQGNHFGQSWLRRYEMSDSVGQYLNEIGLVPCSPRVRSASCPRRSSGAVRPRFASTPVSVAVSCARPCKRRPPPRTASSGRTCGSW